MPSDAPQVKQAAVRDYGARVVLCPARPRGARRDRPAAPGGVRATYVPPFNHRHVQAGQGTVALELPEQVPDLDALASPWAAGPADRLRHRGPGPAPRHPHCRGAAGANDAARSKAAGEHLPPVDHRTMAGGLLVGLGPLCWPTLRDEVEAVVEIEEPAIADATRLVMERMKLVIEPSSGVPVAAALHPDFCALQGIDRVGVILCGGNIDLDALPWQDPA